MYAGHIGIALAATARRPDVPLAALIGASLLPDALVSPLFHTVPAMVALVLITYAVGQRFVGAGLLLAALVLSHFLVDLVMANLRVWPGRDDVEVGLGLYDYPPVEFVLEAAIIVAGWFGWRRSLADPAPDRTRPMLVLLLIAQLAFAVFVSGTANDR